MLETLPRESFRGILTSKADLGDIVVLQPWCRDLAPEPGKRNVKARAYTKTRARRTLPAHWPTYRIAVVTFFFVSPAVFPADHE